MPDQPVPDTFDDQRAAFDHLDLVWMDGEFVDWEDATVHVLTHGLHYGTSVFEGVRCYDTGDGPAIFRWDDHLDRFYDSARALGMAVPFDREALTDATVELIRRQHLDSCYVRPIAFYGYQRLGVTPSAPTEIPIRVAVACWPWGTYLGEEALESGVDVAVSSWRKYSPAAIPSTAKLSGPYVNGVLAGEEARRNGYAEALLLNSEGNVAEGPGENIFLVRDGELYTPGLAEGVLAGTTRDSAIRIARDLGYAVHDDATISRGELYTADELFFTGTAAEVTPIRSVDDVVVGDGSRGPVTEAVQSRFFDVVRRRADDYDEWFTYVEGERAEIGVARESPGA